MFSFFYSQCKLYLLQDALPDEDNGSLTTGKIYISHTLLYTCSRPVTEGLPVLGAGNVMSGKHIKVTSLMCPAGEEGQSGKANKQWPRQFQSVL